MTDMILFNSSSLWKFDIKYLHQQSASLEDLPNSVSRRRRCTFLRNLHTTWCIFCEDFQLCQWSIQNQPLW